MNYISQKKSINIGFNIILCALFNDILNDNYNSILTSKKISSLYACVKPITNSLHPKDQDGFQHGLGCSADLKHQAFFKAKKKAGVVFIDLTVTYDTIWHCDLTCKLLRLLSDMHTVRMILELVQNQSFTVNQ